MNDLCETQEHPAWWRTTEDVGFVSEPMKIGKTLWRLVVYRHHLYGNCTEYEWLNQSSSPFPIWERSEKWPRYNSNDTYNGLPRTLVKIFNGNIHVLRDMIPAIAEAEAGIELQI